MRHLDMEASLLTRHARTALASVAAASCVLAALGATAISAPAATARALPRAVSFTTCDVLKDGRNLGPTYVTSLKVAGVSCTQGVRVVKAYYRCRVAAGGVRGTCNSPVDGYKCTEKRQGIKIQFDAKVTCKRGAREVYHTYVQDT
jgi:hypothetical protein